MEKVMHETARRLFEAAKLVRPEIDGPADLARALNQSEQVINNWSYRGENGVSRAGRLMAQKEMGISAIWIEDGTGPMLVSPQHILASTDKPKKSHKAGMIEDSANRGGSRMSGEPGEKFDKNVTPAPPGRRRIPVISYVQAGMMTEVVDPFALGGGFEIIEAPLGCSERTFGLRIEGNSMEPRFHDGDVVVIDPSLAPRPGDFVVGKNGKEEATFKKYLLRGIDESGHEVFELAPLNEDYPTLHSKRNGLVIIGVCVGRWEVFREM